jgi:hypothetical protein
VFVLVADLMIPISEDYIAMSTGITGSGDMGSTMTGLVQI